MSALFLNRREAGRLLALELAPWGNRSDVIVLALPRGGVPVGYEVARSLNLPLDVFLVRKLGLPGHEELAMGAVASGGLVIRNQELLDTFNVEGSVFEDVVRGEIRELERRENLYRGDRPFPDLTGKVVVLVDDGLATGSSVRAAVAALQEKGPRSIIVAVPIAPVETCDALREIADEVICARTPEPFHSVGLWYRDFEQTTDEEVRDLLQG